MTKNEYQQLPLEVVDGMLAEESGGYKVISPVINSFCAMMGKGENFEQKKIISAIGRSMDLLYFQWEIFSNQLMKADNEKGFIPKRTRHCLAWAAAEESIVILDRLYRLINSYNKRFYSSGHGIDVPKEFKHNCGDVRKFRNAIEHGEKTLIEQGSTLFLFEELKEGYKQWAIFYCPLEGYNKKEKDRPKFIDVSVFNLLLIKLRKSVVESFAPTLSRTDGK